MAELFEAAEERTESATVFRREEFRKQGSVALSRESLSVAVCLGGGVAMAVVASAMLSDFRELFQSFFSFGRIADLTVSDLLNLSTNTLVSMGRIALPILAVALFVGVAVCVAQVGFFVTWEPLLPDWNRLNPINGFQRVFSSKGFMEGGKSLVKLAMAGVIVWLVLRGRWEEIPLLFQKGVGESTTATLHLIGHIFFTVIAAFSVMAILDYAYQKFQLEKQMKMTRREAKEEFKLREGDPLIKSRIRSIQRRIASRRMMEEVPKSDVVVTNPTHFAVALKYDSQTMSAPKVVAKGAGLIAQKIREIAYFNRVPVVENKPLAQTLFREIDVGEFIPKELYKAVAEVLSYVYRLRGAVRYG